MKCLLCDKKDLSIITKNLRNGKIKNVYYCADCDLGILEDKVSDSSLKKFYQENYRRNFTPKISESTNPQELFDIYSDFQETRLNLIKGLLKKDMKLLEIGCSAGMFLYKVKNYVKEVVGLDYDTRSAEFAKAKCSCEVYDVDIEITPLGRESFDVICIFQTLEHVKNPSKFIKKIKGYLKPGGIIFIEVPNIHDALIEAYDLPNHYGFYFHSAHQWYFSKKSLDKLMKSAGFNGKIYFTQDYNILNHMHWISVDMPQDDCILGLSKPRLPIRKTLEVKKKEKLVKYIEKMDLKYKEILIKLGISSNISFIGKLK